MPKHWRNLATLGGQEAAWLGVLELHVGNNQKETYTGSWALQQFANEALFRLVIFKHNSNEPAGSFCLPPDSAWVIDRPKKVRSDNESRALKIEVDFTPSEGFRRMILRLPYGPEAELFGEAFIYAAQCVRATLSDE